MQERMFDHGSPLDLEDVLDRFEEAWRSGVPPEISDFIPPDQSDRRLLAEMVMIDLYYRWQGTSSAQAIGPDGTDAQRRQSGWRTSVSSLPERPWLEDYVRQYPEIGPLEKVPLEMIREEYRIRQCWGDNPTHDDYAARFSQRASEVRGVLVRLDQELAQDTARTGQATTATFVPKSASVSPEPTDDRPVEPETIGKYRVIGVLDRGGQAEVYRAVHPTLAKELVVKLSRDPVRAPHTDREHLVEEGKVLADLDHPNLAQVYDLDFHEDRPFLVMEYIRGRNLHQQAKQARPAPREAAKVVAKVARALSTAHARGVVHQDIKPENVVIDESGEPRLIDFGLARLCHAWVDDLAKSENISGTIQYMAPEQAQGDTARIGERADVFGLGAVLYYLLVGHAPFEGEDRNDCYDRACRCDFDKSALCDAATPGRLEKICLRAMERDPADRYPTADALAADLECFAAGGRLRKSALAVAASAILIMVAVSWIFSVATGDRQPPPEVRQPGEPPVQAPDEPAEKSPVATYPERPLRHDFPFRCELLGEGPDVSDDVTLAVGQRMTFRLESDQDCYVGIWHIDKSGTVTQLFPNKHDYDHFLEAGKPRIVPGEEHRYYISVTASDGPEFLHVIATTERWESLVGREFGPHVVFATPEERAKWEEQLRGFVIKEEDSARIAERVMRMKIQPNKTSRREED